MKIGRQGRAEQRRRDRASGQRNRATAVTALAILLCAVAACRPAAEEPESPPAVSVHVHVTRVRRGAIADILAVMGQTEALSVLRLASPVAGRITMLSVRPGDEVAAGAVVARIIPLENEAALHGFALLERGGALSATERDTARRLQNEVGSRDVPLRVPFAGVVAERLRNPGEQVASNDVLVQLFDPHSLYVVAQVPASAVTRVHTGQHADIGVGQVSVSGRVDAVMVAVTPQTLTVPVRLSLSTPLQPPLLHAAVDCRLTLAQHPDALLIPRSALVSSAAADSGTVMLAVNGQTVTRTVQLGLRTPDVVEVTAGLAVGDLVLTQGQYALPDGTRIEAGSGDDPAGRQRE